MIEEYEAGYLASVTDFWKASQNLVSIYIAAGKSFTQLSRDLGPEPEITILALAWIQAQEAA